MTTSNSNSDDILSTLFQFLPSNYREKVITSSSFYPNIELISGTFDLDNKKVCNSFIEDNFKILIQNPNLDRQNLFQCVVSRGLIEYIKVLLEDKRKEKIIDPSADNNKAIISASKNGHTLAVKLLLTDPRVNPSARDNEAIRMASINGQIDVVKLLLIDKRVNPSARNNEAFRLAFKNEHLEIVELLLNDKRVDAL